MDHAAAISAVYRAIAHYRRRIAKTPANHSAREIVQMSMLAEYLHESHTHEGEYRIAEPLATPIYDPASFPAAA